MTGPRPELGGVSIVALALVLAGCGGTGEVAHGAAKRPLDRAARTVREAPAPAPPRPAPRSRTAAPAPRGPRATGVPIASGPAAPRRVALTFDADMTPFMLGRIRAGQVPEQIDRALIATLRSTRTRATLFLTGMWAELYPNEARALAADPLFEIGNHTWDHSAWTGTCYGLPSVPEARKRDEVERAAREIERVTGRRPFWFRLPGLCHAPGDVRIAASAGEQTVDGLASGDAFQSDPQVIVRTVLGEVRPGAIIVMHMMGAPNAPATGTALERLIPALRARGYRLVTLSELLGRSRVPPP